MSMSRNINILKKSIYYCLESVHYVCTASTMIAILVGGGVLLMLSLMSLILIARKRKKNGNKESHRPKLVKPTSQPITGIIFISIPVY